jgi:hypothetical protein
MLDQHPRISMAIDPFIPLFRYYRDCLIRSAGKAALLQFTPRHALDDYYYSQVKLDLMRTVQETDPDIGFDRSGWPEVRAALESRMTLTALNLVPEIDRIPAATFKEVFGNILEIVGERKPAPIAWAGFNENWAAEFFPALARLFPDARFILHLRDPRAVLGSSEFAEPDPRKRPTVVSFARHLRKYIALARTLPNVPSLRDRLLITHYEPFLCEPEAQVRRMTDFLGVEFRPEMLDVSRFRRGDGTPHSSWDVFLRSGDSWLGEMPGEMIELVEMVCGADMQLVGYRSERYDAGAGLSAAAFDFAIRNCRECLGWRTDFSEIEHTVGCELFRRRMLQSSESFSEPEVARAFLFASVYEELVDAARASSDYEGGVK